MFVRLFVFIILFGIVWFVVKLLLRATDDTIKCSRCEGKGFWYDARGKEKCDWCKGSGRLPKQ
jgi:DnaJ-class molecular chaperone